MWQLRRSAHSVLTDEGGAILDERTGRWTYLTPTAVAAVVLLLASTTEDQAAEKYAQRYDLESARAAADVRTVADTLIARGLSPAEAQPRHRRRRWWR